jgi:MOSC domain-containing protein YiiM
VALTLAELLARVPQRGVVQWIGVRPARRAPLISVEQVEARAGAGLTGDHFSGSLGSKRQVTLIQAEHLGVIADLLGRESIDPGHLRRNIVVRGINLLALNGARFSVGGALLEGTGGCHPCSRMEEALGEGGYNVMRGHGGITASVIQPGIIRLGDEVALRVPGRLTKGED